MYGLSFLINLYEVKLNEWAALQNIKCCSLIWLDSVRFKKIWSNVIFEI